MSDKQKFMMAWKYSKECILIHNIFTYGHIYTSILLNLQNTCTETHFLILPTEHYMRGGRIGKGCVMLD